MGDTGEKTLTANFGNQIADRQIVTKLVESGNLYPKSSVGKAERQLNLYHKGLPSWPSG